VSDRALATIPNPVVGSSPTTSFRTITPSRDHPYRLTMALPIAYRVLFVLLAITAFVYAEKHAASIKSMSVPEIESKLQAS
jgi:hypothetical protein